MTQFPEKLLTPVYLARIYLVVGLGLPVCTGVIVFAIGFTGYALLAKEPFAPRSDLIAPWAFTVPAGAVLFLCRRAYHRVARGDHSAPAPILFLAKLVPALILLGIGGGIFMTHRIITSAIQTREMLERSLCEDVLSYREGSRDWTPADEKSITTCLPDAHRCDRERRKDEVSSQWHVRPDRDQRPEIICLRKAGHAAGWLH
jgi:hypothetical protein